VTRVAGSGGVGIGVVEEAGAVVVTDAGTEVVVTGRSADDPQPTRPTLIASVPANFMPPLMPVRGNFSQR
jgi:hypothetical protein